LYKQFYFKLKVTEFLKINSYYKNVDAIYEVLKSKFKKHLLIYKKH